jgi:hypothetical protein
MSAYLSTMTPMTDRDALVAALADLGLPRAAIEVHEEAVPLEAVGWLAGSLRGHVVVRRRPLGVLSNDMGFERTPTGFRAHISPADQRRYGKSWLAKLHEAHDAHHRAALERLAAEARLREAEAREAARRDLVESQRASIHEKARRLGYRVEEKREGGTIRLVLSRRVYG